MSDCLSGSSGLIEKVGQFSWRHVGLFFQLEEIGSYLNDKDKCKNKYPSDYNNYGCACYGPLDHRGKWGHREK
jgi:hypothetical protein